MKIALCLSGQPRSLQEGFHYHSRNLIEEYDVDVFVHSWNSDFNGKVLRLYKPTRHQFENIKFDESHDIKYKYSDDTTWLPKNALSAFYSLHQANSLKSEHEKENGFIYDWVLRSRFDYALNTIIPFNNLDNEKLYTPDRPDQLLCDQFAFSSSSIIDKYANTFNHIDEFYSKGCWMLGEHLLANNIYKYGLDKVLIHYDMKRPFQDVCEAHAGLIRNDHLYWIK